MNPINSFKKRLLNFLMPYIEGTNKKTNSTQEKRFRDLFKKRRSTLIVGGFVMCLITFGIAKSFSFITWLIVCSPFIVILWSSYSKKLMVYSNSKKIKNDFFFKLH